MMRLLRYLWAGPNTAFGLCLLPAALVTGGGARIVDGAMEIYGGFISSLLRRAPFVVGGASALTLGHVILGIDPTALDKIRRHEHVHIRQYEKWGPLFLPAYLGASMWLMVRGKDPYHDNPFEKDAI
jgi:hypothetical protein